MTGSKTYEWKHLCFFAWTCRGPGAQTPDPLIFDLRGRHGGGFPGRSSEPLLPRSLPVTRGGRRQDGRKNCENRTKIEFPKSEAPSTRKRRHYRKKNPITPSKIDRRLPCSSGGFACGIFGEGALGASLALH